ncbi:hypothetical protein AB0I28_15740 [Phytomonospora sp. NPDC050363]|uniref:hypothetical protein n=1 Tax=Phytomonospora sp. NPDC050363 TaxID=3155642 RepID=UPI0033C43E2F
MFAELDRVDWSALTHAYGPADDVPEMLRGLVSSDPATREEALDGLYGAVHHQGDVYECTVAAIPFLLDIAADTAIDGRGDVLDLVASIGGVDDEPHTDPLYEQAHRAVTGAGRLYLGLLTDPDAGVRRAAVAMSAACGQGAEPVAETLRRRFEIETDPEVLTAIIAAMGRLGGPGWLGEQAAGQADPVLRLTALTAVARQNPDTPPPDIVATALATFGEIYAHDTPPTAPAGFSTDTLIGALREEAERQAADRRSPQASSLLHDFSEALGDRVEDRTRLLTALLGGPAWETRYDAALRSSRLLQHWRGDYDELVGLVGEQLADEHPRLRGQAAETLKDLGDLAAPAADALAAALSEAPREAASDRTDPKLPWLVLWEGGEPTVGPLLYALARLRDRRALPALRWVLESGRPVRHIGPFIGRFGAEAAELVPVVRTRLRELGAERWEDGGLVQALIGIGEASAGAVDELLALPPHEHQVLTALGAVGPRAADAAMPVVRGVLDTGEGQTAVVAARSLWRLGGDPGLVLPVLLRSLSEDPSGGAAAVIAELGPVAAQAAGRLRKAMRSGRAERPWPRLRAAVALWKVTGDADAVLPLLSGLWPARPFMRRDIAECLADMGTAAAPARALLRAEVTRKRRHNSSDNGWSSEQVPEDLALLRACRTALRASGATDGE